MALLGAVGLAGCSPLPQSAVTLDEATGLPALVVVLCDDDGIEAVRLSADETGTVFWEIEADEPQRPGRPIVVGETPPGFSATNPHRSGIPVGGMRLTADGVHGGVVHFDRDELEAGVLVSNGGEISRAGLGRNARMNCSSSFFGRFGLPSWLDGVALVGGAGAAVAGLGLVLRQRVRRL